MKKENKLKIIIGIATAGIITLASVIVAIVLGVKLNNLQGKYEKHAYYNVTFETNEGEKISPQFIFNSDVVERPADPKKDGYKFGGWFRDIDFTEEFDFSSQIDNDLILYAKWDSIEVPEDKDSQNNQSEENEESNTEKSSSDNGSHQNSAPREEHSSSPSQKTYYTVSFDSNGGSSVSSQTVEGGSTVGQPSNPTKAHYNFSGWMLNGSGYNFNSSVNSNITLVANWTQKSYKIVSEQIDPYSPDVKLSVTEDGAGISFSSININGAVISASSPYISRNELSGGTYTVVLSDGVTVNASL